MEAIGRFPTDKSRISFRSGLLQLVLPVLSGVLLYASFPPIGCYFLAFFALIPLSIVLASRRRTAEAYLGCYLGGVVFQLLHLDWLRTSYGGHGLEGSHVLSWLVQGIVAGVMWLPILPLSSLAFGRRQLPMIIALPLVWTTTEILRKWTTILFIDEMGSPWGYLGYSQSDFAEVAQMADLLGVFGISAFVAAINGAIFDIVHFPIVGPHKHRRRLLSAVFGMILCVGVTSYGVWRLSQHSPQLGPRVCIVPSWDFLDKATFPAADLLVGSELDSNNGIWEFTFDLTTADTRKLSDATRETLDSAEAQGETNLTIARFTEIAKRFRATAVFGVERFLVSPENTTLFNGFGCVSPSAGYQGCYDKICLVPWTEFTPNTLFRVFHPGSRGYTPGRSIPLFKVELNDSVKKVSYFAPSICYDNCYPELYRQATSQPAGRPDFLVQIGSEQLDTSQQLGKIMLQMARMRTIECRRSMVRHALNGISAIIDGNGIVRSSSVEQGGIDPIKLGIVPIDDRVSVYAMLGDIPILLAISMPFLLLGISHFSQVLNHLIRLPASHKLELREVII